MLPFSRSYCLRRAPRKGARLFFVVSLLGLYQCAPVAQDEPRAEIPSADAEAKDVLLQLVRPGTHLQIRAAQVREYSDEQVAIADGGVEVTFYNAEGQGGVHLRAERLRLDHKSGGMGLAGGVVLRSNDSLEVQADTLSWEAEGEHLRVPGSLIVVHAEGREQGRDLETDSAAEAWLLYDVVGRWNFAAEDEVVEVRAARERSQRQGNQLQIRYEEAELRFAGMRLTGAVAHWVPGDRQAYFSGGVEGLDSSGHFSARDVEVNLQSRRLLARGAVKSARGSAKLEAEEFVEEWQAHKSLASGYPARYEREGRGIEARHIRYRRDEDWVEADSQVVFREGERSLGARHLVYRGQNASVEAHGGVLLNGPELEGILSGDSLFFDLDLERGWMVGTPILRRSDQGELQLSADSMSFDLRARELSGSGHFALEGDGLTARARVGHYDAEKEQISFADSVVLEQGDSEGEYRSRIVSDSLIISLEEGVARQILILGELEGKVEMGDDRVSWIEGRGGRVWLADTKLERIELDAKADATYRHIKKDEVSRFRGQRMFLYFDENGLYQVRVEGDAKLVSRLVRDDGEPAVNEVIGQELDIYFTEGSIVSVQVGPEIEGTYFPPEKEE